VVKVLVLNRKLSEGQQRAKDEDKHNKSMDVRARAATFLTTWLVKLKFRMAGFASGHFNRSALSVYVLKF
jgi:hypothetical protein